MGFSEFEEVDEPLLLCLTREDYWEILEPYTADPSDGLAEDYSEDTFQVQFYALDHVSDADWLRSGVVLAFIQRYGMQVTGLWIENLFFEELVHLMDFIALFPTINSLEIFYCNWLAIGNLDQFDTLVKSSALVSLSVDNCEPDSTALAGWLARAPSLEVRQMNWAFTLGDPDIASHTALLQRTGNHLTHLNLDVIFLVNLTYAAGGACSFSSYNAVPDDLPSLSGRRPRDIPGPLKEQQIGVAVYHRPYHLRQHPQQSAPGLGR